MGVYGSIAIHPPRTPSTLFLGGADQRSLAPLGREALVAKRG